MDRALEQALADEASAIIMHEQKEGDNSKTKQNKKQCYGETIAGTMKMGEQGRSKFMRL